MKTINQYEPNKRDALIMKSKTPFAILCVPLLFAALLSGCSNIPKAQLTLLQADCPNIAHVRRPPISNGASVVIQLKRAAQVDLTLDSTRTLKRLSGSTNLAVLTGGHNQKLVEVCFERPWQNLSSVHYTLERLKVPSWADVQRLSDEQVGAAASQKSSLYTLDYSYVPLSLIYPVYPACPQYSKGHCTSYGPSCGK